jgi:hypothetical protein
MRRDHIVSSAAIALVCAGLVAAASPRAAYAMIADKLKSFSCSSGAACVSATNTDGGPAVTASAASEGVIGISSSSVASGVYGENDNNLAGYGVAGVSQGISPSAGIFGNAGEDGALALAVTSSSPDFISMILGTNMNGSVVLNADNQGNLTLADGLFNNNQCYLGCAGTRQSISYTPQASEPGIEDVGEVRLREGLAFVPLERAYANAIDTSTYVVLVTPEDSVNALYVAARRSDGFVVREAHGGRSSAQFAYRLVAHPYGVRSTRFPVMADLRLHPPRPR